MHVPGSGFRELGCRQDQYPDGSETRVRRKTVPVVSWYSLRGIVIGSVCISFLLAVFLCVVTGTIVLLFLVVSNQGYSKIGSKLGDKYYTQNICLSH